MLKKVLVSHIRYEGLRVMMSACEETKSNDTVLLLSFFDKTTLLIPSFAITKKIYSFESIFCLYN